jgi:hypothetical protein
LVRALLIATAVGFITALWACVNRRRPPQGDFGPAGNITPGKVSAATVTFVGVVITTFGVASVVSGALGSGFVCLLVGVALTIFMGPSLTHMHDVSWNSAEVNGPSTLFGLSLGRSRTTIRWDEVASTGKTITSYWFIQAADGRRIYWSYLYPGYGRFVESLIANRPQIELPEDLR